MFTRKFFFTGFAIFLIALLSAAFFYYPETLRAISSDVLISEVSLGREGANDADYIKLINTSAEPINLKGYRLVKRSKSSVKDTSIKSFTADTLIAPGGFFIWANSSIAAELKADVFTSQTLSLDNCLALRQGAENDGLIIDALGWGACAQLAEGQALCNPAIGEPMLRQGETDTDNNQIDFATVCATDNADDETGSLSNSQASTDDLSPTDNDSSTGAPTVTASPIIFNEILPDPNAADENPKGEFIEIYNQSDKSYKLKDHYLVADNIQIFKIADIEIPAKSFLAFYRGDTGLKLNNSKGEVKLFSAENKQIAKLNYADSRSGQSFGKLEVVSPTEPDWAWSLKPTPGEPNNLLPVNRAPEAIFICPESQTPPGGVLVDASDSYDPEGTALTYGWKLDNKTVSSLATLEVYLGSGDHELKLNVSDGMLTDEAACKIKVASLSSNPMIPAGQKTIAKTAASAKPVPVKKSTTAKSLTPVSKVSGAKISTDAASVSGQVFSLPGQISSQYFYVLPDDNGPAWQIYSHDKKFPDLITGARVSINGRRSSQQSEPRLLLDDPSQITVTAALAALTPEEKTIDNITLDDSGRFVKTSGQITAKKGQLIYLDDGNGELAISLPGAIKTTGINSGDKLIAQGLVKAGEPLKLAVRTLEDLEVIPAVVAQTQESSSIALPETDTNKWFYLWGAVGFVFILAGGWLLKRSKK